MYTTKQLKVDLKTLKFTVIVVAVTGECNLNCEFCAYNTIKCHKKMSYETVTQLFDEIDSCPEEENFLICWSGGEPTYDIDHLLACQKIMLDRNYRQGKITQAMMTNGWWANDDEVVEKIKSMNLDIIGVSGSECHIKDVPEDNMVKIIKMFEDTPTTVWIYLNGKCYDLYPNAHAMVPDENQFAHAIRRPNWTIHDVIKFSKTVEPYDIVIRKDITGLYLHPNGAIGSSCAEEGNCPCMLGNIHTHGALWKAVQGVKTAKTRNLIIKNCTIENCNELRFSGCRFCKQAGFNVSCFTDSDEVHEIEFDDIVKNTPEPRRPTPKY